MAAAPLCDCELPQKETAIEVATPAAGCIADIAQRDCRHIPPHEQLDLTIHRMTVWVEGARAPRARDRPEPA
jgi:hypothetical protein